MRSFSRGAPTPRLTPHRSRVNPRVERGLAADLDRIFGAPWTSNALWGVAIKSLDTGRVLYSRNAATLMMPASNMKIVTLAAAAETLGWDYTGCGMRDAGCGMRDAGFRIQDSGFGISDSGSGISDQGFAGP